MTDDAKNFMHYSNTEYDDVFNTAYTTVDDDVKVENYKKAQMILQRMRQPFTSKIRRTS